MTKKFNKGDIGYLSYQKKYTLLRTLFYFGIVFAIFTAGLVTTKSKNNLLTIVAVLGCLPASKSLVNMIMYLRFKPISSNLFNSIDKYNKNITLLYNMLVSSKEKIRFIQCIAVSSHSVYFLCNDQKIDDAEFSKYIKNYLSNNGKGNVNIKLYRDEKSFCSRLNEINEKQSDENKAFENKITELINIICL